MYISHHKNFASTQNVFSRFSLSVATCILLLPGTTVALEFSRVTDDPVVMEGRYSEGASWADINNDGYLDVFVPHLHTEQKNVLFVNNGDGSFTERFSGPVVNDSTRSTGGSFGDFDNDGDLDLFVCNYYGMGGFLYLNNGAGSFQRASDESLEADPGSSFGSSVVDYDNDGFLDIYVTNGALVAGGENNFLYHNNGDGSFTRMTNGPAVNDSEASSASSWCDYDGDGDLDLFVANGFTEAASEVNNALYQNNGDGSFTSIDPTSIGLEHSYSSCGTWADYDNDGDSDLFITNFLGNDNSLYQNNGNGTFTKMTDGIISNDAGDSVSSAWGDYDNDGDLDLYVTNDYNEDNALYRNNGDASFTKIIIGGPSTDGGRSNGASWVDYNNDGSLDLFIPNGQRPEAQNNILYRNNAVSGNSWVNIKCIGIISNATAIGTRLLAKATIDNAEVWQLRQVSGSTGFNAQSGFHIEFGLGDAESIDSLIIDWPSGIRDIYTDVAVGLFYEARENLGLSSTTMSIQSPQIVASDYLLSTSFPNPFNPVTIISYTLPQAANVDLTIFNSMGQMIRGFDRELKPAGKHQLGWDASDQPGGIYCYQVRAGGLVLAGKMIYLP